MNVLEVSIMAFCAEVVARSMASTANVGAAYSNPAWDSGVFFHIFMQ